MKTTLENIGLQLNQIKKQIENLSIKANNQQDPFLETEKPLTLEEASNFLNLSKSALYGMVARQEIPYYKFNKGKTLYFFKSELITWLKSGRRKTISEIQLKADKYSEFPTKKGE